jgi:hypothetical protein
MGGAFIDCQDPLERDEIFLMAIKAPNHKWLSATNKVTWVGLDCPDSEIASHGMGTQFITISDETSSFLHNVISH